ncbi:MAG: DNA polymerase III subunit delta' [Acetobacteraceae bacterium]|nr:DNA polymerase III subunit delta' [Acetobacteraceae bacterium]
MLPDPRANSVLFGHEAAEGIIAEARASGRMHHACLITGPAGIGKATLAYRFARRLLGDERLDPAHPLARRIAAGAHADLFTLQRTISPSTKKLRGEIVVEDVRAAGEFLRLTPAEGGWRVVIVDRADELNRNAANALLKILEEPPGRSVLLLVAASPGRLPATVRSRCRRLALRPLPEEGMAKLLAEALPDLPEEERIRLASLAEGSPGRALRLADQEWMAMAGLVGEVLAVLPELAAARMHEVADMLARSDQGFSTFFELLRAAISKALRDAARGRANAEQGRVAALRALAEWGDVWHALSRLQDETEAFALDKRQAVIQGLSLLTERVPSVV